MLAVPAQPGRFAPEPQAVDAQLQVDDHCRRGTAAAAATATVSTGQHRFQRPSPSAAANAVPPSHVPVAAAATTISADLRRPPSAVQRWPLAGPVLVLVAVASPVAFAVVHHK